MKTHLLWSLAVVTVLVPAHLSAQEQASVLKEGSVLKASFDTLKTQHMVVDVKINGKGPYRLIFDTGAPVTLINNKVAKEAGVFPKDFKRPPFAFFGSMGQFTIQSLEIGNVKAEKMPTMVMDHPTVSAISAALGPIEGIVGFSFFAKYRMTIDYQKKEMTFVPVDFQPKDMMEVVMKSVMMRDPSAKKVVAPAGQWGFRVGKAAKDEQPGVNVEQVHAHTPAARAGLQAGDRLLTLDGRWTDSVADCYAAASSVAPGTEARLVVRRQGKEMALTVVVQSGI